MADLSQVKYDTIYGEVIECVDNSVDAEARGVRGKGKQQTKFHWEPHPEQGIMVLQLELEVRYKKERLLKLIIRMHYKVNMFARLKGLEDRMGLPEAMYLAMGYEAWDFAMSHVRSLPTPIASQRIPRPPDAAILGGAQFPPISTN